MSWLALLLYAAVIAAAVYFGGPVLYRKLFLEFADDIPTIVTNPLKLTKEQLLAFHKGPLGGMKGLGSVYRTVNQYKPWMRTVVIGDPNLLKDIFVSKDWELFDRQHPMSEPHFPYTAGFIHLKNGPLWRETRAAFDRTFHTVSVRKYTPILLEQRDILLSALEKANAENPAGFDIYPLFHYYTFDMITKLVFGSAVSAQTTEAGAEYPRRFERWMTNATRMNGMLQLLGKWSYVLIPDVVRQWREDGEVMFRLVRDEMDRVDRGTEPRNSILDDALALVSGEKASPQMADRGHLEMVFMSMLFGGHDTTAALLGFLAYELSKRPDVQDQIRAEVAEAFGDGPIDSMETLEKLKVLNAAIKETLRKYPSAPFGATRNMFQAVEHTFTDVAGKTRRVKFLPGDRLLTYIWGIQNFPGYWERDPAQWAPERFYDAPSGDTKAGLFAYSPFGNGARRCVGERLGLGEARLAVSSILRKWRIAHVEEKNWKFQDIYQATIRPNKVMVRLEAL
ncbi:cytochrome P450 [Hyaloraphidium curvatum]|nr:cytochrome P450 [Hyaloraphidium curvatum]